MLTSWTYTYDNAGNIQSKNTYAYTTGTLGAVLDTVTYTYDTGWGDLLTAYDGTAITTDGIGNMLSDGTWSYTWKHGRQLASMSDGTSNWTFTYDADGLRIGKTNGSTAYQYYYRGSELSVLKVDGNTLCFGYDADSTPVSVLYNGTYYFYVTNLQGDVIGIVDGGGNVVVNYVYDAWGNILHTSGSMASTLGFYNPLRYRGYVYDQETGLYYLQSRYYKPDWGRFINADAYVSTGQGILGNNMFAYCGNNPVVHADYEGNRYCAATSINQESLLDRSTACDWQKNIVFEESKSNSNPANTPPDHPQFTPPKGGDRKVKNPNGKGRGWIDKSGNIWVWTPGMHGGDGWTVNYPGGGHGHAYPGGGTRNHCSGYQTTAESFVLIFVGGATTVGLIVDDLTLFGVANDSLIAFTGSMIIAGFTGLFEPMRCFD